MLPRMIVFDCVYTYISIRAQVCMDNTKTEYCRLAGRLLACGRFPKTPYMLRVYQMSDKNLIFYTLLCRCDA